VKWMQRLQVDARPSEVAVGLPSPPLSSFPFYTVPGIQPTATKQPGPATFIEGSGWVRHSMYLG